MELDINPEWVSFASFTHAPGDGPGGVNLLAAMYFAPGHYLQPFSRDFFAVFDRVGRLASNRRSRRVRPGRIAFTIGSLGGQGPRPPAPGGGVFAGFYTCSRAKSGKNQRKGLDRDQPITEAARQPVERSSVTGAAVMNGPCRPAKGRTAATTEHHHHQQDDQEVGQGISGRIPWDVIASLKHSQNCQ